MHVAGLYVCTCVCALQPSIGDTQSVAVPAQRPTVGSIWEQPKGGTDHSREDPLTDDKV